MPTVDLHVSTIKYYISTVNIKVQVIEVHCNFLFPVSSARGDRVDLLLLDGILLLSIAAKPQTFVKFFMYST